MANTVPQLTAEGESLAEAADRLLAHRWRDPVDGTFLERLDTDTVSFKGGLQYPRADGVPILLAEQQSLFTVADVVAKTSTTQSASYRDPRSVKNYVRQRLLPSLSNDAEGQQRFRSLGRQIDGGPVLILGAGDKAEEYRQTFPDSVVINTDVHTQFGVDLVLDGHSIPYQDDTFAAVLLPQVLEHVARPWLVAAEIERVTRTGGLVQVEVPFAFPVHGAPFDFYRFTPTALRFLFPHSELIALDTPEGNWGGAAVALSNAMVETFSNRYLRMAALAVSRVTLGWMKLLDRLNRGNARSMPKGFAATYRVGDSVRPDAELLEEPPLTR